MKMFSFARFVTAASGTKGWATKQVKSMQDIDIEYREEVCSVPRSTVHVNIS